MQIRTRLFLGTAGLVVALVAAQWWLHARQLRTVERALGTVATSVGQGLLQSSFQFVTTSGRGHATVHALPEGVWVDDRAADSEPGGSPTEGERKLEVVVLEEARTGGQAGEEELVVRRTTRRTGTSADDEPRTDGSAMVWTGDVRLEPDGGAVDGGTARVELEVVGADAPHERFLVMRTEDGSERRIRLPAAPTAELRETTLRGGAAVGAGLLLVGLVSSGVLAHRLARPLGRLSEQSEALGRGDLGVQVDEDAGGEIGELQRAFNRMSRRLAELEVEREQWRRREHLAALGDVARGLAHTVRNPLNTLGLTVEELAAADAADATHVATARAQIRRIDGWLRSFLALGAADAAERSHEDLRELVDGAAFALLQQGAKLEIDLADAPLPVEVVPTAVRAALSNLLDNAVHASPAGAAVRVEVRRVDGCGEVVVSDRGPGLPDDVRRRLFEPHVTTRAGGSGMGLFLARQIVVVMHSGEIELADRDGGGTVARMRLPLTSEPEVVR